MDMKFGQCNLVRNLVEHLGGTMDMEVVSFRHECQRIAKRELLLCRTQQTVYIHQVNVNFTNLNFKMV